MHSAEPPACKTTMACTARADTAHLLAFNQQVLDQALAIVGEHAAPGAPPFAGPVGAHLRHVIEHYDALALGLQSGVVDYDSRPRDPQLEASPALARKRLAGLHQRLATWTPELLNRPLQVRGQCGTVGDFTFSVASSGGRELAFVAGHAVHHFALLSAHLQRHGIHLPPHFGKAPATVAHETATRRGTASETASETTSETANTGHQASRCLSPTRPA